MKVLPYLLTLIMLSSCAGNIMQYGKVKKYNSGSSSNHTFLFKVEGEFVKKTESARMDEKHMLMNEEEVNLLNKLLLSNKMCLDDYSYPNYVITSKQERIYDVTFANLIEQNYNAKPVTPRTYFGRCV